MPHHHPPERTATKAELTAEDAKIARANAPAAPAARFLTADDFADVCVFCGATGPLKVHGESGDLVCADNAKCIGRGYRGAQAPALVSEVGTLTPEEMAALTIGRRRTFAVNGYVEAPLVRRLIGIIDRLAGITPQDGA